MSTLYLCAAGNPDGVRLAIEVNEAEESWDHIVLLDDDTAKHQTEILGIPVIGGFSKLVAHKSGDEAVNLVARSTKGRDRARSKIEGFGIPLTSLVHPNVNTRGATLGRAVTIYDGCTISALSSVSDHSVVFTRAVLGHGATLGIGAVVAPGAVVNARVNVGERAYIGSNASVLPDLTIGQEATVSACSAAIGDLPDGSTALGVPAEIIDRPSFKISASGADENKTNLHAPVSLSVTQEIFAKILGSKSIGSNENFFDAGGTSKQAIELQVALEQEFGVSISIVDIFRFPSPTHLASHLLSNSQTITQTSETALRRRRFRARS